LPVLRVIEAIYHFWTFWRVSNSDSDCDTAIRRHLANKFIINFPHYVNTRCDMKGNGVYKQTLELKPKLKTFWMRATGARSEAMKGKLTFWFP